MMPTRLSLVERLRLATTVLVQGRVDETWHHRILSETVIANPALAAPYAERSAKSAAKRARNFSLLNEKGGESRHWVFYRDALRMAWLDMAPSPELREQALEAFKTGSSLETSFLFERYPAAPTRKTPVTGLSLGSSDHQWWSAWLVAIHHEDALTVYNEQKFAVVHAGVPMAIWAAWFDHETVFAASTPDGEPKKGLVWPTTLESGIRRWMDRWKLEAQDSLFASGLGVVYHAAQTNATDVLKAALYRGFAVEEKTSKGRCALSNTLEQGQPDSALLLARGGAIGKEAEVFSNLCLKFQPGLDEGTRDGWLDVLRCIMDNERKTTKDKDGLDKLSRHQAAAAFKAVTKKREPRLLACILEHLDRHKLAWQGLTLTVQVPKEGPGNGARTSYSLIDAAMDMGMDAWMAQIAGFVIPTPDLLYRTTLWSPEALGVLLGKTSDATVQLTLASTPPVPTGEDGEEIDGTGRRKWEADSSLWAVAAHSRNPGAAFAALAADGRFSEGLNDELSSRLYQYLFLMSHAHQMGMARALDGEYRRILGHGFSIAPDIDWVGALTTRATRNPELVDWLVGQDLLPTNLVVDAQGNTVLHRVLMSEDADLLGQVLAHPVIADQPNDEGITALEWARLHNPDAHGKITVALAGQLQAGLAQASQAPRTQHRL
jgi:hypothetical protein